MCPPLPECSGKVLRFCVQGFEIGRKFCFGKVADDIQMLAENLGLIKLLESDSVNRFVAVGVESVCTLRVAQLCMHTYMMSH